MNLLRYLMSPPKQPNTQAWSDKAFVNSTAAKVPISRQSSVTSTESSEDPATPNWNTFSQSTTVHGLRYGFSRRHSKFRRTLWLTLLTASLGFLLWEISNAIIQYNKHASMLTISEEYSEELRLPAVTICNNNMYKASMIRELYPHVEGSLRRWAATVFGEEPLNLSEFDEQMNNSAVNDTFIGIRETMPQMHDVFVRCKIGSHLIDCASYTTQTFTDKGTCYTFNSGSARRGPLSVSKQGHMTAIQLTLDVQPDDYFLPHNYGTGFMLSIHDQHELIPNLEDRNIMIPPGMDTYISLVKTKVKKLGPPYSKKTCVDTNEDTQGRCRGLCKAHNVYECWQCNSGSRPVSQDPNLCTFRQVFDCSMVNIPRWYNGDFKCDCPMPCKNTIFEYTISFAGFPNTMALDDAVHLNWTYQNASEIKHNYANVNVYYEQLKTVFITQTPLLNTWQLFSSIGGLMGLALGTSLMTILEFCDFAIISAHARLQKVFGGDKCSESCRTPVQRALGTEREPSQTTLQDDLSTSSGLTFVDQRTNKIIKTT